VSHISANKRRASLSALLQTAETEKIKEYEEKMKTDKESTKKVLETKIKELINTIEVKTKIIMEKDDQRIRLETDYSVF
jgi:predicted outer membrane protein